MSLNQTIVMTFMNPINYVSGVYDSVEVVAYSVRSGDIETGLPVVLTSSNTNVAVIYGNLISILRPGITIITASQAGNSTYAPAQTSRMIKVFLEKEEEVTLPTYATPVSIQTSTLNNSVLTIQVEVKELEYTYTSGIAYGLNTGYSGVVTKFGVITKDQNNQIVSNHITEPLTITFSLPMANPSSILMVYKTDGIQILNVQPTGYPVLLTYTSGTTWTGQLPSLSEFAIIDTNPPSGFSGGDPYIRTIYGETILIPNEWKYVRLYQHNDVYVYAKCRHLEDAEFLGKLHCVKGNSILPSDVDVIGDEHVCPLNINHWWVFAITYMVELDVYYGETLGLKIDLLTGEVITNKKIFPIEKIEEPTGLYSLIHKKPWEKKNMKAMCIYIDNGNYIKVKIDNHWDDVNNVNLYLSNKENIGEYEGEFFGHDDSNNMSGHIVSCENKNVQLSILNPYVVT